MLWFSFVRFLADIWTLLRPDQREGAVALLFFLSLGARHKSDELLGILFLCVFLKV